MARTRRARALLAVRRAGFLVAPAGLDFVVGSTTCWLYEQPLRLGSLALQPTGLRIACDAESLATHAVLVRVLAASLHAAKPVGVLPSERARLRALGDPGRALVLRAARMLDALEFEPTYRDKRIGYLFDLLENGFTVFTR